jgi:hypothetical protein
MSIHTASIVELQDGRGLWTGNRFGNGFDHYHEWGTEEPAPSERLAAYVEEHGLTGEILVHYR